MVSLRYVKYSLFSLFLGVLMTSAEVFVSLHPSTIYDQSSILTIKGTGFPSGPTAIKLVLSNGRNLLKQGKDFTIHEVSKDSVSLRLAQGMR